ncbi:MAG: NAD(P)/FAD-dependent oxidoreductase [Lachnoclostridium sp.]|nr:NAD(P)/FAD-dependent oxidoreductase [Lachnospira sp.]MCM1249141.1 NAD(P)/FAD-dependent oxidoreductase [Lachnoclostridium sp.]MCM1536705.1 NAD(P)/FAD-dependent oxidoreductase [Clostridium sp.]
MQSVIVIGGGAAGMMAAIAAAQAGASVTLLEKNEKLGKKLFITGKGRCNVTNSGDAETFFSNICTNGKFLYSAFYGYDNRAVTEFLEKAGCPLKVERGERVFPVSDRSSDIIGAFKRELNRLGVKVLLHTRVAELCVASSYVYGVKLSDGSVLKADKCIVCTGGMSYPATGSTGDGYHFAQETGHRLVEARPALVPLETEETWCRDLMGLSLKNVSLRMIDGKKELYRGFGEMLFTHFGVSGPLVLSASSFYGKRKSDSVRLLIDLKPALDEAQMDKRLLREFEQNKNKQFKNALGSLFPSKLIPVMIKLSGIHPDKKVNEITREERRGFSDKIKNLPLTVKGTRSFEEAIITQGGVSVKDINPSTMESKLVKNLYFAGEVLDLDAMTGGFNLQIAWSTGHLAGKTE